MASNAHGGDHGGDEWLPSIQLDIVLECTESDSDEDGRDHDHGHGDGDLVPPMSLPLPLFANDHGDGEQVTQASSRLNQLHISDTIDSSAPEGSSAANNHHHGGDGDIAAGAMAMVKKEPEDDEKPQTVITLSDNESDDTKAKLTSKSHNGQGRKRKASTMRELTTQMKYCQHILDELLSRKHRPNASPFYGPFDAKSFDLAHYYDLVDNPMDLGIVRTKMENRVYDRPEQFARDIRLIFTNCFKNFRDDHELFIRARRLQEVFEVLYAQMPPEPVPPVPQLRPRPMLEGPTLPDPRIPRVQGFNMWPFHSTWSSASAQIKRLRSVTPMNLNQWRLDRANKAKEMRDILGDELTEEKAYFWLDRFNWNLTHAISFYLDDNEKHGIPAMKLVSDVTIGEGEEVPPNTEFVKTWRIMNSGSVRWPPGCRLCFVKGDQMADDLTVSVRSLAAGQSIDISVRMISPENPGIYSGEWRMSNQYGEVFGETIWVIITVSEGGLLSVTQQMSRLNELGAPVGDPTAVNTNPFAANRSVEPKEEHI